MARPQFWFAFLALHIVVTRGPVVAQENASEDSAKKDQDRTTEWWVNEILKLPNHNQSAFRFGPKLTLLPPDEGLAIVQQAWPKIKDKYVKTGLLKAFEFGEALKPIKHPHLVKVLHLGMTDSDRYVQEYAAGYLMSYAKEEFAPNDKRYLTWFEKYGDKALDEIIRLNLARVPETLRDDLGKIVQAFHTGDIETIQKLGDKLGETNHPYAIPTLIGIIDADNSYETVYWVGHFGIGELTNVDYSPFHDGAWWRRWWEANRNNYPQEIATQPVPNLPKTKHGKDYQPFPDDIDTIDGKLRYLNVILAGKGKVELHSWAEEIAVHEEPRVIPVLIGLVEADKTRSSIYGIGYYALQDLTGVQHDDTHDGKWWREWWEQNKDDYPEEVQSLEIPNFKEKIKPYLAIQQRRVAEPARTKEKGPEWLANKRTVKSNPKMDYFQLGPRENVEAPKAGYKLIVIMPGGGGNAEFHPFVRRMYEQSFGDEYIAVQPVAFKWKEDQQIVWPTRTNPVEGQKFATEDFAEAIIKEVREEVKIDSRHVYTLSWSSCGPAAYALSLAEKTPVRGSFVAMSIFNAKFLPDLKNARGQSYFIEHSPDDRVCPIRLASQAKKRLKENGAAVFFNTYEGGHGWHGNYFARITGGMKWLEARSEERDD